MSLGIGDGQGVFIFRGFGWDQEVCDDCCDCYGPDQDEDCCCFHVVVCFEF